MYIAEAGRTPTGTGPVAGLRETVDSGQVTLEPGAGEQLRTTLAEQIDQVDVWLAHVNTLTQRAPLGANPVGEAMAAKFELRAHGDPLSFVSILTAYRDVLTQTLDTVTKAVHAIQQVDSDYSTEFTGQGGLS
jgi:hypothetical protein